MMDSDPYRTGGLLPDPDPYDFAINLDSAWSKCFFLFSFYFQNLVNFLNLDKMSCF